VKLKSRIPRRRRGGRQNGRRSSRTHTGKLRRDMPKDETNIRKNRSIVHGEAVCLAAKCCPLQAALPLQSLLSDTATASDPIRGYYIMGCHGATPTVIAVAEPLGYYVVMDEIACWHLQLRGTQPTPCCMHHSRPRQRFPRQKNSSRSSSSSSSSSISSSSSTS
jgi:hypothetical protein